MQAYLAIPGKGMHESPAQETQERNWGRNRRKVILIWVKSRVASGRKGFGQGARVYVIAAMIRGAVPRKRVKSQRVSAVVEKIVSSGGFGCRRVLRLARHCVLVLVMGIIFGIVRVRRGVGKWRVERVGRRRHRRRNGETIAGQGATSLGSDRLKDPVARSHASSVAARPNEKAKYSCD